jgi:signal transduction histidine kinase
MASLIDDLLGLSRTSRQDLLRQNVDLSAMATAVIEELREAEPERHVDIIVAPQVRANADPALLRVILGNLLGNAWKFTSKHDEAHIQVGVIDADGQRAFFVRDDGAGFDAGAAQHLFGAFQRFHTAQEFEGNGIGLATVQRLVIRHGGRVWAEAEVEKGATFFFTLPEPAA